MAADGLYESRRRDNAWTPKTKLPPEVNTGHMEIGAVFSPSGKTLLFARDTKGPDSGEFFLFRPAEAHGESGPEDWPPGCPARP